MRRRGRRSDAVSPQFHGRCTQSDDQENPNPGVAEIALVDSRTYKLMLHRYWGQPWKPRLGAALERDELERLVGGRLRLTFDEILNDARLPMARRAYLASFLHVYEGDPFLVR